MAATTWTPRPGKALALRTCETAEDGTLTGAMQFVWSSTPGDVINVLALPTTCVRDGCGGDVTAYVGPDMAAVCDDHFGAWLTGVLDAVSVS